MSKYGNRYSKEFKAEAVRLLLTSGKTAKQLGKELGVSNVSLGSWRDQALAHGDQAGQARPEGVRINYAVLRLENQRLKKELEILRQEREILKKSLGILPLKGRQRGMP